MLRRPPSTAGLRAARWDAGPCRHEGVLEARRVRKQTRSAFTSFLLLPLVIPSIPRFIQFYSSAGSTAAPANALHTTRTSPRAGPCRAGSGQEGGAAIGWQREAGGAGGDWLPHRLCSAAATVAGQRKFERRGGVWRAAPALSPRRTARAFTRLAPVPSHRPGAVPSLVLHPELCVRSDGDMDLESKVKKVRSGSACSVTCRSGRPPALGAALPRSGWGERRRGEVGAARSSCPVGVTASSVRPCASQQTGGRAQVWGPCVCETHVRYLGRSSERYELTLSAGVTGALESCCPSALVRASLLVEEGRWANSEW